MSDTRKSLFWMFVFLALVGAIVAALFQPMQSAFLANWGFNAVIAGVLLIGIIINVVQVIRLQPEIDWLRKYQTGQTGTSLSDPVLLKPLASELSVIGRSKFRLSALSLRTVLDGIRSRLDESREISRYIIGLLIFLGLLGTFWGLLGTISSVGNIIGSLDANSSDYTAMFAELKTGLREPLNGMGTAFSSSLLGLAGSLILGFLDIQASQAQNRFFNRLEEWLSSATNLVDDNTPLSEQSGFNSNAELIEELREHRKLLQQLLAAQQRGNDES